MSRGKSNARILTVLKLFRQAPRTRPELEKLMKSRQDSVSVWVELLEEHGFIRMRGNRPHANGSGRQAIEWEYIREQ